MKLGLVWGQHRSMHVVILHNAVSPGDSVADRDVLVQVEAVSAALAELGHSFSTVACTLDLDAAKARLARLRPDVVFNLVETLGGSDWLAVAAAALLDSMGLPYTGSPTEALLWTNHKLLAKQRLNGAGLPTPEWVVAKSGRASGAVDARSAGAPRSGDAYVIKALWEHASFDLEEHSVVSPPDEAGLERDLRAFTARLGRPCYAERYVDGREFNLAILAGSDGPNLLPLAEIDFSAFPPGGLRIVGHRAKWEEDSFDYHNTPTRFDFAPVDEPLVERLRGLGKMAWELFGLRGYARVDFRVDAAGQPWILEVNANPCLSPDAGYAAALDHALIPFPQGIARILDDALR